MAAGTAIVGGACYLTGACQKFSDGVQQATQGSGSSARTDEDDCDDDRPCRTVSGKIVAVGTIAYRPMDTPSRPQHGIAGPHCNLYRANKNPGNGRCFWQPIGAVPPAQLPPGAMPIEPFAS